MSKKKENTVVSKDRIERFAQEYAKSLNVSQSAINAGYSEKTAASQGSRLLKNVKVITRVRELQNEMLERLPVSIFTVIQGYLDVYNRCMTAIPVTKWDYTEKMMVETGDYVFDSKGALSALDSIGKYLGMFTDKVKIDANVRTTDKLGALLESLTSSNSSDDDQVET